MSLVWRIVLLILMITLVTSVANFMLMQHQQEKLHQDSEEVFVRTVVQSLRDTLVQDVIDGNKLRVTNMLRDLVSHDNPIEYLYIAGEGKRLFAHSFKDGFPRYLLANKKALIEQEGMMLVNKYQTEQHLIYEYCEVLIPGLNPVLYIGINQSSIAEKFSANRQVIIMTGLGIALVALLAAFFWGQRIVKPLGLLVKKIADYGKGKAIHFDDLQTADQEICQLSTVLQSAMDERRQALKNLQESEQQVLLLLNSTAEGIYGIDIDGCCTFVNQACISMLGYQDASELIGKNMHDLIHHSDQECHHNPVENCFIFQVFKKEKGVHVDNEVLWRRDGSSFAAEYWSYPIFKEGKCVGAVVTFLDITERVEALKALQEREQLLSITLNSIGDAVITTDENGNVTHLNPIAEQLTGWTTEEAKGQAVKQVFPIIDASTRQPIENPIEKILATGEIVYLSNHTTLIARDRTEYQIADSAAPIRDDNGIIRGMVLVCNDVTEKYQLRQDIKQQLERFKELSKLALTLAGEPQDVFENIARLIAKLLDVKVVCLSEVQSEELNFLCVYVDGKIFTDAGRCDLSITPCATVENDRDIKVYHRVTELFPEASFLKEHNAFSYCGFPALDANGRVIAVTCLLDDQPHEFSETDQNLLRIFGQRIGLELDRVKDQKQLKQQQEQLRHSQKMDALGQLTGGIAHDFNNMLGVIMGYAQLLEDALSQKPKLTHYSQQIKYAGERGTLLTKKLLSFSQQESSKPEALDLNEVLLGERHILEKTLTARIKLELDLADDLWLVQVDSGDLEDAILNMCINAMHAIENQGQLVIQTRNIQISDENALALDLAEGDYVSLSVKDTGAGMDKATKARIFEPFFTTKGSQGTGLGLSQVYGFVERSGGSIKIESEIGQGTEIVLHFPRFFDASKKNKGVTKRPAVNLRGNETILVVDDESALLKLTTEILCIQGYQVISAGNAKQALAMLEHETIDVLLTDVIMPDMSGYQLAAIVQKKYPSVKIQLASGFTDEHHVEMEDDSLHQNILYKPYDSRLLLERIRKLLDK